MNIIILCDGFEKAAVEFFPNVVKVWEVREVYGDILMLRVLFQD